MDKQALEKRLAGAVAENERLQRELFDEDTTARFEARPDWTLVRANRVFTRVLGFDDGAQLAGRNLAALSSNDPVFQKMLALTRAERRAGPFEFQLEGAGGEVIDVACSVAGSFDADGTLRTIRGQIADITERKHLEMRLIGAERMEVIGRLAGGLAHDFNNLLTVISGNSERLLERMPDDEMLKGSASAISDASARAASMTRQLLAYSRRQVFDLKPVSVGLLIEAAQPLLEEILGDHITVRVSLAADLPLVNADVRQIEQVMANLAHNAREAMPAGGTLTIKADGIDVGESAPRGRQWLRPGRYLRVLVADSGHGMDPVTKSYAFQPFFTTKRMGNGRGLGLATVYGIVKQSNGFVWVDSEPEQGATFTLLFPAIPSERKLAPAADAQASAETILVVEEDAAFRRFICAALDRRGYRVIDAESGGQALHLFASYPSRIHLVVADSGAVTDEGAPLLAKLQAIDPRVQSLVLLGAADVAAGGRRALPTTPAIQKPFTLLSLANMIRDVLNSGEGRG